MAAQYGAAGPWKPKPHLFSSTTFTPCHMFFYGTLMDAKFIQVVTRSPDVPVLKKGYITGFRPKKWATYPTLIPLAELPEEQVAAEERKLQVHGVFWKCEDYDHFKELQRYETSKYRGERVQIHTNDPDDESNDVIVDDGVVFVWAMNPQSPDLEEGEFDIAQYQKDLKPSFFG
ncbi:hypothetical protein GGR57DRAFT_205849 [Xylariaceae sp. FL1272]|nr:hypothetical protein GGR57DRAFT_205849 [Xylariaceae sp. FL1272]